MKHLKICEALCIVVLALFIALTVSGERGSELSAKEIASEVISQSAIEGLTERKNEGFKKSFGVDASLFDSVAYYSSDDIMNVGELLIVKLKENDVQANNLLLAAEQYAQRRLSIFEGYAQQQSEMLKSYVLKRSGNCIMFCVCEDSQQAQDAFYRSLR